jgi:hypothetical protein
VNLKLYSFIARPSPFFEFQRSQNLTDEWWPCLYHKTKNTEYDNCRSRSINCIDFRFNLPYFLSIASILDIANQVSQSSSIISQHSSLTNSIQAPEIIKIPVDLLPNMHKIETLRLRPIDPTLKPILRLTLLHILPRRIKLIPVLHSLTFWIGRGPSLRAPVEAQQIVFLSLHVEGFAYRLAFDIDATMLVCIVCGQAGCCLLSDLRAGIWLDAELQEFDAGIA